MWGKNSHIILPDKPPSYRIWNPVLINKRTKPIKSLYCGSWHAIAITGFPDPLTNNYSDTEDSDQEMDTRAMNGHHQNGDIKDGDGSSESDGDFADLPQIVFKKDQGLQEKEGTKLTIAEFYAQEDNETNYGPSAAGGKSHGKEDQSEYRLQIPPDDTSYSPNDKPESAKSRIIVQVPTPNVVNVATSPIPFSSSDSGSERASSPHHTLAKQNVQKDNSANYKNSFQPSAKTTKFEESPLVYRDERSSYPAKSIPYSYEREKSCISNHSHPAPIVQVSKRTADMFSLPRENTNFTSRQIDLTEVEYARAVNSSRAHEKQFWVNKLNEARSECNTAPNPLSLVPQDEFIAIDSGANKTAKYSESVVSRYGRYSEASVINLGRVEGLLDGTPTKMTRSSMSDYGKQFGTPEILEEARRAAKLPPRGKPTSSIPRKKTEANFALQISRSDTIVAPLKGPIINAKMKNLKLNPLERYASVHNPLAGSKMVEKKSKAGIQTPRNVSIPGGRSYTNQEEDFYVQGQTGVSKMAMYSSAASWRSRSDFDRVRASNLSSASPVYSTVSFVESADSKGRETNGKKETRKPTDSDKENVPKGDKSQSTMERTPDSRSGGRGDIGSRTSDKSISKTVGDKSDQGQINNRTSNQRKGFGMHRGKWQTSLPQTG